MTDAASAVVVAALEGSALTSDERIFFEKEMPAGVTLFTRNFSPRYVDSLKLIQDLKNTLPKTALPYVIAIDQEGGRVARLKKPFPDEGPPQLLMGGKKDETARAYIENYGFMVGAGLKALGVNVDFAPVLDILTELANTGIGDRVFGTDPAQVTARAGAFLSGLQHAGILGCLKHFPGQGHAGKDTHFDAAVVDLSLAELQARELIPFQNLMPQAALVMMAHVIYPQVSGERASASRRWIEEILRGEMQFNGVVVSDDMNMAAVPQADAAWQEEIVESVANGVDMVLVCRHLERCRLAIAGLRAAAKRSKAFAERLKTAAEKVQNLRRRLS